MLRPLRLVDDKRSGRDDGFRCAQPILRGTRGPGLAPILDPDFDLTLTYEAAARPANLGTKVAICRASRVPQGTLDARAPNEHRDGFPRERLMRTRNLLLASVAGLAMVLSSHTL